MPRVVNAVLTGLLGMEARLIRHGSLPFGVSIVVAATRPSADPAPFA